VAEFDSLRVASGSRGVAEHWDVIGSGFISCEIFVVGSLFNYLSESKHLEPAFISNLEIFLGAVAFEADEVLESSELTSGVCLFHVDYVVDEVFGACNGDHLGLVNDEFGSVYSERVIESYCGSSSLHICQVNGEPLFSVFGLDTKEPPLSAFAFNFGDEVQMHATSCKVSGELVDF
jgi:hypothetical protein